MNEKYARLAQKAERILRYNICSSEDFPWGMSRMIEPGKGWGGIWNWDSAFHAIGVLNFDEELAKEQITGFLKFQCKNGMTPDVIWENGEIEDRFSKPPMLAYAAMRICRAAGDTEFARQVYPALARDMQYRCETRCTGGLFHYDADRSDGCDDKEYEKRVCYESGWDNSIRFDNGCSDLYAVDLNCFTVMAYDSLAYIAEFIGEDGSKWKKMSAELSENIRDRLFDDEIGAYCDCNCKTGKFTGVLSPASFMPLYAGIADEKSAECMNEIARKHFLPAMPTAAYDDSEFSNDYWRGPCWLNVAYFAAKGLKNYGFSETADTIRDTILDFVFRDGEFIHENYDAVSGKGLCCDHFSWSSVFVLEFIHNF